MHLSGLGCVLAVCGVIYFAAYRPLCEWRSGVGASVELVRTKLADGPRIRRRHRDTAEELEELLASVDQVNSRVPTEPREGEFLGDLSRLARVHDVRISDFRRGRVDRAATHSAVSVALACEASHEGLCGLLDAVGELPRLASLTKLRLRSDGAAGEYPIELEYLLYYGLTTPE